MYFNFTFLEIIKVFAQMVHANFMCCGQGVRLVVIIVKNVNIKDNNYITCLPFYVVRSAMSEKNYREVHQAFTIVLN